MKHSYLIQRLMKPFKGCENNPFNFGGGLRNGGICQECFTALNQIFRFDYMGAAEFEFGIVPKVLNQIFHYHAEGKSVNREIKIHGMPVYYLCHEIDKADVEKRIRELARREVHLKEYTLFDEALAARVPDTVVPEKKDKYKGYADYIGWLELDNNFIFFLDKEPMEKFTQYLDALAEELKKQEIKKVEV